MAKLRPFKDVQLQWLRLLLLDTELSARAFKFATYLAVKRINPKKEMAWLSHSTVCEDLGVTSERTINRLIKELDGKWFDVKSGNGLGNATEYVPSKASHIAAHNLRAQEERDKRARLELEKADNIVHLPITKGGHSCPERQTEVSSKTGQKCLPKKDPQKRKKNTREASGLFEDCETLSTEEDVHRQSCPVTALLLIHDSDVEKISAWNNWLSARALPKLKDLMIRGEDASGAGYLMPRRLTPIRAEDEAMVEGYVRWAADELQEVSHNG